ncbi:putative Pectinesterase inhibitor 4 [Cocos nucifera]|uniref:Putative Pectinesterase inhibitor 4 n=1 Tax=Cocos nucifera TaxID=13894 RepID=A0A8K0NB11_COCNU|nr:putative Pectinesterase inhibitor 4 [Cocos nucifera]
MRPEIPLLLFLSLSSLLRPAIPDCLPRNSSPTYLYDSSPLPAPASAPSPSPKSSRSPSPSPSPCPARSPSLTPTSSSPSVNPTPSPAEEPSPSPVSPPVGGPSLSPFSSPSTAPVHSSGLPNAVVGMCHHTDYPDLCLSSISPLLPAFGTIDAKTLLTLEMKACRSYTETARTQAAKLANENPSVASILQSCTENYEDAFDDLDSSAEALAEGDKGTLNSMLSALLDDYGTCEDGFTEMSATSPMASYDDTLTKLASNCLALADLVKF